IDFDRVSKKRATTCTPADARIKIKVVKMVDPVTKKDIFIAPDGYNGKEEDDAHSCDDTKPSGQVSFEPTSQSNRYRITVTPNSGTFPIDSVQISVGGAVVTNISSPGPYTYVYTVSASDTSSKTVSAVITDQ